MKSIIDKIDYSDKHNQEKVNDLLEMMSCSIEKSEPEFYNHIKTEIYEMVYGKTINETMAKDWTHLMRPAGEHWNIEATTKAMQDLGYNCDRVDFYVVSNMLYNDYYNIVKDDESLALKMAYDWLNDEDISSSGKEKLYNYYKYVVKGY